MTNDLRWKVLSERIVVKDQWIDLRAQRCLTPRGAVLDPFYLLALPDFVHVVALTGSGDVVLVREYRHAIGACVLNLPGGWIDAGEHRSRRPSANWRKKPASSAKTGARSRNSARTSDARTTASTSFWPWPRNPAPSATSTPAKRA